MSQKQEIEIGKKRKREEEEKDEKEIEEKEEKENPPGKKRVKDGSEEKSMEIQKKKFAEEKKKLLRLFNKLNKTNFKDLLFEVFEVNLIRMRKSFSKIFHSQIKSTTNKSQRELFCLFLGVINSKLPIVGEAAIRYILSRFKVSLKNNDHKEIESDLEVFGELFNYELVSEVLVAQILSHFLDDKNLTEKNFFFVIKFFKIVFNRLNFVEKRITKAIFDRLEEILKSYNQNETNKTSPSNKVTKKMVFLIEEMFDFRRENLNSNLKSINDDLNVQIEEQFTHILTLNDEDEENEEKKEESKEEFEFDQDFDQNEQKYCLIKERIIGKNKKKEKKDEKEDEKKEKEEKGENEENEEELGNNLEKNFKNNEKDENKKEVKIIRTKDLESNEEKIKKLRKKIYLTIISCIDFEEAVHKLLMIEGNNEKNDENKENKDISMEIMSMVIECCCQERTYLGYYGQVAERLCRVDKIYETRLQECFILKYMMVHRLELNKLRNIARLFGHCFATEPCIIPDWSVLDSITLTEETTNSSSRIFIKLLFQDIAKTIGISELIAKLQNPLIQIHAKGLFPAQNAPQARYTINFWTHIGLAKLTLSLREKLQQMEKLNEKN